METDDVVKKEWSAGSGMDELILYDTVEICRVHQELSGSMAGKAIKNVLFFSL